MAKTSQLDGAIAALVAKRDMLNEAINVLIEQQAITAPKPRARKSHTVGHFDAIPAPPKARRGRPAKQEPEAQA